MPYIISATEIALLIVLPLILFYQWSNLTGKKYISDIALLYLIWFFTYACMHELSHMFGSWIMGTKILDYQLIPPFWRGDFSTAYVDSFFENKTEAVVSLIMPYLRDIILLITGFWFLRRRKSGNYFLTGLILILLILSPLFDIINNYSGFIIKSYGDFKELSLKVGIVYTNVIGSLFALTAIFITMRIFLIYRSNYLLLVKR